VFIRPNGEVVRTGPKVPPLGGGKKYSPRFDQQGQEIPDNPGGNEHNTGEILLP
jgi:hypothetical protein